MNIYIQFITDHNQRHSFTSVFFFIQHDQVQPQSFRLSLVQTEDNLFNHFLQSETPNKQTRTRSRANSSTPKTSPATPAVKRNKKRTTLNNFFFFSFAKSHELILSDSNYEGLCLLMLCHVMLCDKRTKAHFTLSHTV